MAGDESGKQGFEVAGNVEIVGVASIPLDHRELWTVPRTLLAVAEARPDLVYLLEPGGKKLLHLELGRGAEESAGGDWRTVDVAFGRRSRDPDRRLDFQESALVEERADSLDDLRSP